ncbi:MAG: hypothetical protein MUF58_11080 [Arcicella sp.]|jgi:hypothetical protein|nr:hypothetical protein [Microscillaceae bacterium]MCU0469139.1 hypothetical protein [Arcicella sp.]
MNAKNELKSIFTEYWKYLAVNTACKLKLFDKIFEGQNTLEILCSTNQWDKPTLSNLVSYLVEDNYLIYKLNPVISLLEKGELLIESNPKGLYYACLNWAEEHLNAWQHLDYSVKTAGSSFEKIYKKPYFDYLNDNPEKLINYHKAIYEYASDDYKELPNMIDFSIHNSIMDVGGGYGAAISLIKEKNQNIRCILFDLQKVIEQITNENIVKLNGNFFESIPNVTEAILLTRVLHDWNDEKAKIILKKCFLALPSNGTLYVIENCKDKIKTSISLLSLNMTAMCQSFERSSLEYIKLCEETGFNFQKDKKLNELQTILIFKK